MGKIETHNLGALALRDVNRRYKNLPPGAIPEQLSKGSPYFGYIDIEIDNFPLFSMFSANDDMVAKHFFWDGKDSYEPMSLKIWGALAKQSGVILDIGSYTGIYSLLAATINHKSKIYAFEALDIVYSRLLINKHSNNLGNLTCFNAAVGAVDGNIELSSKAGDSILSSGSSISKVVGKFSKTIKCVTLGSIIDNLCIDSVDLIKIDVEGAELDIIKNAEATLLHHSPDMLIEFLSDSDTELAANYLKELGYRFYQVNDRKMQINNSPKIQPASSMYTLNTLVTKKSLKDIESLFNQI